MNLQAAGDPAFDGCAVTRDKQGHIIRLAGAARKCLNRIQNNLLQRLERRVLLTGQSLAQPEYAVQLIIRILRLGDAVAEQDQRIARLQLQAGSGELGVFQQADRKGAFAIELADLAAPEQQRRRMAGLDVFQPAIAIQQCEEHGCIAAHSAMRAEKFVDVVEDAHRVRAQGHRGKRSLQHHGQQRRPQTFAADIGNQKRGALGSDGECIEVVAAHFMAGVVHSGDGHMRKIVQALRKQSLLNRAGDGEFLLQACRSRSRSTSRALSRMLADWALSASRICRSRSEKAAGLWESR